jgi:catechol 2,3-dioxygenase-like lactoylglutathione lyase family enzyme
VNLNQVTVGATDIARSAAFYRALGLVQIVASPHYARFECPDGEATFSIHQRDHVAADSGVVVYFECARLDERVAQLQAAGLAFTQLPTDERWLWREARLRDPDGNELCLFHAGTNRRHPPWRIDTAPGAGG